MERTKIRKTPAALRKPQILAMQTAGLTQTEIAHKLGVSRRTICKDLDELQPAEQQLNALLTEINTEYARLQTPRQIAENYVNLATSAKCEPVRLTAQDRILEHRGVVTEKQLLAAKSIEPQAIRPMFVFARDVSIDVGPTPTSRESAGLHNIPTVTLDNHTTTSSNDDD